jgi:hypothetical protein
MNTKLPLVLETKLADFRRRVWAVKLSEGILAALFSIAVSYLVVFILDRLGETPGWLRLSIFIAGLAALLVGLPLKWLRWVWRQRRLEDAARLLRGAFPRLGDQLLGIVELARGDHLPEGRSERLVEAAIAQAAEAVKDQDFSHAVPRARHLEWGWATAGAFALVILAFVFASDAARNALARWAASWQPIERYTFAKVEPIPTHLVAPYAEPFTLPVKLTSGTLWSPEEGKARIDKQPTVAAKLSSGAYSLPFPPQKKDARLSIWLGDVRKTIAIEPRTRPDLSELAVRLRLPAYLGYKSDQHIPIHSGSVNLLKGAEAAFEADASRELAAATMDGAMQPVAGRKFSTAFSPVSDNADRQFSWKDVDGLSPHDPLVLKVRAVEDQAPSIIARRESQEEVVLDSEVVSVDLDASDDFGVKRVGLSWVGSLTQADGQTPIRGEKIGAAGGFEKRELQARATFCAVRDGVEPQTLEIRAWADDYLPARKHSYSASFVIHVLNKEDHALWLTQQFGKWLDAARESYERELQLHESNKELRRLSAADLDRPENRRRVSQQATGESASAARVDALTESGRRLVEQGTKNDIFDAKRLETWATMLKSLKDIAANRMPSVADLLKQTASANPGGNGTNQTPTHPSQGDSQQPQSARADAGKPAGPSVSHGANPPGMAKASPPTDPNAPPKPPVPSISDRESGFGFTQAGAKPADSNTPPKPPGSGKLGLPNTILGAAPTKDNGAKDEAQPPASPAQEKLQNAVTEQKDLLAEFAKVSDQLAEVLASLEASTFVKRFKAASRQQMKIATNLSHDTLDAFGIEKTVVKAAAPIARNARTQSEIVGIIQSDLEAYFERKQDVHFKKVLEEMKSTDIVRALDRDGVKVSTNLSGQAMIGSEYWADTLDRWGEDLVGACNCKCKSSCSGDSLPPEIVLKVMKALRDEMKLRDETRETENSREALEAEQFERDARGLGENQGQIETHTQGAVEDILALPEGASKFGKELRLLNAVVVVMQEARGILDKPDTGPTAVAAETEAIELLLQAKRMKPGGGGGGANPGGGTGPATASTAALSDLGPGDNGDSLVMARPVGQATGRAGKEFPEEFKAGLDAYFNLLESPGNAK